MTIRGTSFAEGKKRAVVDDAISRRVGKLVERLGRKKAMAAIGLCDSAFEQFRYRGFLREDTLARAVAALVKAEQTEVRDDVAQ